MYKKGVSEPNQGQNNRKLDKIQTEIREVTAVSRASDKFTHSSKNKPWRQKKLKYQ